MKTTNAYVLIKSFRLVYKNKLYSSLLSCQIYSILLHDEKKPNERDIGHRRYVAVLVASMSPTHPTMQL